MNDLKELASTLQDKQVYMRVFFRIEAGYIWGQGMPVNKTEEFEAEVKGKLTALGFAEEQNDLKPYGSSPTMVRGAERLYCHPMDLSGHIKKESLKEITSALQNAKTFKVYMIDPIYDFVIFNPKELRRELDKRWEDLKKATLESYHPGRGKNMTSKYYFFHKVSVPSMPRFLFDDLFAADQLRREIHFALIEFQKKVLDELIREGFIVTSKSEKGDLLYRTATKKEIAAFQKQKSAQAAGSLSDAKDKENEPLYDLTGPVF